MCRYTVFDEFYKAAKFVAVQDILFNKHNFSKLVVHNFSELLCAGQGNPSADVSFAPCVVKDNEVETSASNTTNRISHVNAPNENGELIDKETFSPNPHLHQVKGKFSKYSITFLFC